MKRKILTLKNSMSIPNNKPYIGSVKEQMLIISREIDDLDSTILNRSN